jgi:hypothetical protein
MAAFDDELRQARAPWSINGGSETSTLKLLLFHNVKHES